MTAYRREIDGLRAVAVLPVILFHAGFAPFSGGFVGVDVFFVISGYLITSLVLAELDAGRFSFRRFYERRIRRLAPALVLVVLATVPAALALMTPGQFEDYAQSVVAVALLASNLLFWHQSGYFVPAAEMKPLLHTWSLAVEEQFYLVFPLLLVMVHRFARRWIVAFLLAGAGLSAAVMLYLLQANPTGNFFLSPSRFWELLAGALCALRRPAVRPGPGLADGLAGAGLLLIGLAVFAFDEATPFPSAFALLPVGGTALVILFAGDAPRVRAVLALRPVVWLGLISYSAYLWHQPLFVFARLALSEPPGTPVWLALIAATLLLAHLTWRLVERPFRHPRPGSWVLVPPRLWAGYVAASAALIAIGLSGHFGQGFPGRFPPADRELLAWLDYAKTRRAGDPCLVNTETGTITGMAGRCLPAGLKVLLIGDSHAQALTQGWQGVPGLAWLTGSACPPIRGYSVPNQPACGDLIALEYDTIVRHRPAVVLIHAHWSHYATPARLAEFGRSLDWLAAEVPQTRVVVIGSIPKWYPSLPEALVGRRASLAPDLFLPLDTSNLEQLDAKLAAMVSGHPGMIFVSLIGGLCRNGTCRAGVGTSPDVAPIIWDNAHLTRSGAELVRDTVLAPALAAAGLELAAAAR